MTTKISFQDMRLLLPCSDTTLNSNDPAHSCTTARVFYPAAMFSCMLKPLFERKCTHVTNTNSSEHFVFEALGDFYEIIDQAFLDRWDEALPGVTHAINTTESRQFKATPFSLFFGRPANSWKDYRLTELQNPERGKRARGRQEIDGGSYCARCTDCGGAAPISSECQVGQETRSSTQI
jgi:hypothetical protein